MKNNIIAVMVACGLIAGFAAAALALEQGKEPAHSEEKITTVSNTITGRISNIDKTTFAVEYASNEATGEVFEMLFPLDKDMKVVHKNGFSEFSVGDTVEVQFVDTAIERKNSKDGKRVVAALTFIKAGTPVIEQTHVATNSTVTTGSTESVEALPLKSDLRE
jgi:hypothetical protein